MDIISVSRSSFNKKGVCTHTHTINFTGVKKAEEFVKASKAIDALYAKRNKKYAKWQYDLTCKSIY